jgi:hypothetical protein
MRELRRNAEQAGWSGEVNKTILIDVNSLAIKDVHYTTQKA